MSSERPTGAADLYDALQMGITLYETYGLLAQSPGCGAWINAARDARDRYERDLRRAASLAPVAGAPDLTWTGAVKPENVITVNLQVARIMALAELWSDPEFWKDEGCRMDSQDCAAALLRAISGEATPSRVAPPSGAQTDAVTRLWSCGASATGSNNMPITCPVHGKDCDLVCEHGRAMDVHCCACRRRGFFPPEDCDCYDTPAASPLPRATEPEAEKLIAEIVRVMTERCIDRSCEGGDSDSAQAASSEQCRDYYGPQRVDDWCDMCLFNESIKALTARASSAPPGGSQEPLRAALVELQSAAWSRSWKRVKAARAAVEAITGFTVPGPLVYSQEAPASGPSDERSEP